MGQQHLPTECPIYREPAYRIVLLQARKAPAINAAVSVLCKLVEPVLAS